MKLFFLLVLIMISSVLNAEEFSVADHEGNDISIQRYPSEGDLLAIWLVDHEEERSMFETMLNAINASGIEIWRVDLLDAYFLPRGSESIIGMPGDAVAALLQAAHDSSHKKVLLIAYDRMPLPLLRGVRLWQQQAHHSRLSGAILFYPNLFGAAPVAGEDPVIDPIVAATNIPVVIYQPDMGSQRWRLHQVMQALWSAGSPAFAYMVPRVRDWFFMGDIDHGPGDKDATSAIPGQLFAFAKLMDSYPKPASASGSYQPDQAEVKVMELVTLDGSLQAPGFSLDDLAGTRHDWERYRGKVTLVNFWATWCPPCVEEIPSLNRLAARFNGSSFDVVSIDYRESRTALAEFTQQTPVDFPVLFDEDGLISLQWKVFSFPSSFLIDKNGRVRYSANRAIDWDTEEIALLVKELLVE